MLNLYLTLIDADEDKVRFTKLYEQYRHLMFYIAKEILKDEHLSEDAVQEAFLRIAKIFTRSEKFFVPKRETSQLLLLEMWHLPWSAINMTTWIWIPISRPLLPK